MSSANPPKSRRTGRGIRLAKFQLGQVVRHRIYPFRGIIFDVDPVFNSTEEWWESIPEEIRPKKEQPFYHLLAENADTEYVAYVSEQNLLPDTTGTPLRHPQVKELFTAGSDGQYRAKFLQSHCLKFAGCRKEVLRLSCGGMPA
jgi:heat shock protein HspQ